MTRVHRELELYYNVNGTDLIQTKNYIEMNWSSYIPRFLKSPRFLKLHGWDVESDQANTTPTTVTNSRTWDNWMEAQQLADLENGSTDQNNPDVEHAAAASITTTTELSSVNTSNTAPDLSNDELVTLQLKDKNDTSDFAPTLTLPKGKVNKNNFEECMKSSKPISPIPSGSIEQTFEIKVPLKALLLINYWKQVPSSIIGMFLEN